MKRTKPIEQGINNDAKRWVSQGGWPNAAAAVNLECPGTKQRFMALLGHFSLCDDLVGPCFRISLSCSADQQKYHCFQPLL